MPGILRLAIDWQRRNGLSRCTRTSRPPSLHSFQKMTSRRKCTTHHAHALNLHSPIHHRSGRGDCCDVRCQACRTSKRSLVVIYSRDHPYVMAAGLSSIRVCSLWWWLDHVPDDRSDWSLRAGVKLKTSRT